MSVLKTNRADKMTNPSTNKIETPNETLKYLFTTCEIIAVPPVEAFPLNSRPKPIPVRIPRRSSLEKYYELAQANEW